MNVTVTWKGKMKFIGEDENGHTVEMDTVADVGGEDSAQSPKRLVLDGLAGCTGMDVIAILRKMRALPESLRIEVEAEQTETHPKVFSKIHLRYIVKGNVPEEKLKKAIELSQTKYCGVSEMLRKTARLTYEYLYE